MAWSTTARNTAVANFHQASGTSGTITLSPTATVAGDTCIVIVGYRRTASATNTFTAPDATWTDIANVVNPSFSTGLAIFISNQVPAGTTSLAFTLAVNGANVVFDLTAVYACFPGGNAPVVSEGATGAIGTTGAGVSTVPSLTSFTLAYTGGQPANADLVLWAAATITTAAVATPTGTGTWVSVASETPAASSQVSVKLCAKLSNATTMVASGSTGNTTNFQYATGIVGIPPSTGEFFAVFPW